MKRFVFLYFIAFGITTYAQPVVSEFPGNNFAWKQSTSGLLFFNENDGQPGFEVPAGSNNHAIFAHSLLIAGVDSEGGLRSSYARFCQDPIYETCENRTGPLNGNNPNPSEISEFYERFWYVTQVQIELHLAYFDCINDSECDVNLIFPDGYDIPSDFLTWPAHGDTDLGYSAYLAPFYDRNGNGAYNPESGDHPIICGDFATYMITNDIGITESENINLKMGVEIHTQVYGYNSSEPSVQNSLFVQHKIINRSDDTFEDVYLGHFTDFDLGNYQDDYIGTDVQRSMYFAYNGSIFDSPSISGPGYGENLPAMGVKILGGPFADSGGQDMASEYPGFDSYANETSGWGDGIANNERLGLYGSMYFNNPGEGAPPVTTDPYIPIDYYNYLRGVWKDGTFQTVGGYGYPNPGSEDSIVSAYVFYGDSDPLLAATDGIDPNYNLSGGWTEYNELTPFGDRRMIGSSGPFTFEPGEVQYFDYAMVFAQQSYDESEDVVETMKRFADEIVGMECGQLPEIVLSRENSDAPDFRVYLYPNPTAQHTFIDLGKLYADIAIEIMDVNGRVVKGFQEKNKSVIRLDLDLEAGIYLVRISGDDYVTTTRMVKL